MLTVFLPMASALWSTKASGGAGGRTGGLRGRVLAHVIYGEAASRSLDGAGHSLPHRSPGTPVCTRAYLARAH